MMNMSSLKFLLCLLFVDFAQPQEASRTCSQSLMVALKTIYDQNANEVCVSHFFNTLLQTFLLCPKKSFFGKKTQNSELDFLNRKND